jgi:hypothetical protein
VHQEDALAHAATADEEQTTMQFRDEAQLEMEQ